MTSEIERAALYIRDIEQSIKKISVFTKDMTFEDFKQDEKTQDAVHMRLLVIGEAVNNIQQKCNALLERYPQIPWRAIRGMRNKIAHEYFSVIPERTWSVAKDDLLMLKESIEKIKKSEPEIAECLKEIYRWDIQTFNSEEKVENEKPKKRHRMM